MQLYLNSFKKKLRNIVSIGILSITNRNMPEYLPIFIVVWKKIFCWYVHQSNVLNFFPLLVNNLHFCCCHHHQIVSSFQTTSILFSNVRVVEREGEYLLSCV